MVGWFLRRLCSCVLCLPDTFEHQLTLMELNRELMFEQEGKEMKWMMGRVLVTVDGIRLYIKVP